MQSSQTQVLQRDTMPALQGRRSYMEGAYRRPKYADGRLFGSRYTRMLESNLNALVATTQRLYGMVQGVEGWPYDEPECTSDGLPSAQSIAELLGILYESDDYHYMRPSLIYTSLAAPTATSASPVPSPAAAAAAKREASRPAKSDPAGAVQPFETQNGASASSVPSPHILSGSTAPLFDFHGQEDVDSMSCGETSSANTSTTLSGSGSPDFDLDWSLLDSAAFPLSFTSPCSENFPSLDEFEFPTSIPNMPLPLPSIAEPNLEHNLLFGSGNPNTSAASSSADDAEAACPPNRFRDFLKLESEVAKVGF
ncbi:hypothetical protein LZ554_002949 [Drepanopeziza brunnea f. sp. 'monogermtubi']|nr:hypothetical protein LZ554_002949 [Drepanopeziza brunnea f. sp. 'monogermtubi']